MSYLNDKQMRASPDLSEALRQLQAPKPKPAKWETWIEGPRAVAAELDSGIQSHGLEVLYWRVHKVGWFRVRVVFGVQGKPERVAAFRRAVAEWVAQASA